MNHLTCNLYLIFILSPACFPCLLHQSGNCERNFSDGFVFTKEQTDKKEHKKSTCCQGRCCDEVSLCAFCLLLPLAKSIWEVSPLGWGLQPSIFSLSILGSLEYMYWLWPKIKCWAKHYFNLFSGQVLYLGAIRNEEVCLFKRIGFLYIFVCLSLSLKDLSSYRF